MIYTVTCNPALDYVLRLPAMVVGRVNRADTQEMQFGGKGINVCAILHALEIPSVAWGFVGGFTGKEFCEALNRAGISHDFIELQEGQTRINVKIKEQYETEINAQGPKVSEMEQNMLIAKTAALHSGDFLILGGSVSKGMPRDFYAQILRALPSGVQCVVDAEGSLLLDCLEYQPFLIKPNHHELAAMVDSELKNEVSILDAAKELQKKGARNVLVSMAADGAILLDESGKIYRAAAPKGVVKNSTGAGDSMVAGFVAGFIRSKNAAAALRLAVACGSATAFSNTLATKAELEALYA